MIGLIVPVPKKVAESGYIKIWADNNDNKGNKCNWELLAYEYDLVHDKYVGQYFEVTKKEVEEWMRNREEKSDIFGLPER